MDYIHIIHPTSNKLIKIETDKGTDILKKYIEKVKKNKNKEQQNKEEINTEIIIKTPDNNNNNSQDFISLSNFYYNFIKNYKHSAQSIVQLSTGLLYNPVVLKDFNYINNSKNLNKFKILINSTEKNIINLNNYTEILILNIIYIIKMFVNFSEKIPSSSSKKTKSKDICIDKKFDLNYIFDTKLSKYYLLDSKKGQKFLNDNKVISGFIHTYPFKSIKHKLISKQMNKIYNQHNNDSIVLENSIHNICKELNYYSFIINKLEDDKINYDPIISDKKFIEKKIADSLNNNIQKHIKISNLYLSKLIINILGFSGITILTCGLTYNSKRIYNNINDLSNNTNNYLILKKISSCVAGVYLSQNYISIRKNNELSHIEQELSVFNEITKSIQERIYYLYRSRLIINNIIDFILKNSNKHVVKGSSTDTKIKKNKVKKFLSGELENISKVVGMETATLTNINVDKKLWSSFSGVKKMKYYIVKMQNINNKLINIDNKLAVSCICINQTINILNIIKNTIEHIVSKSDMISVINEILLNMNYDLDNVKYDIQKLLYQIDISQLNINLKNKFI